MVGMSMIDQGGATAQMGLNLSAVESAPENSTPAANTRSRRADAVVSSAEKNSKCDAAEASQEEIEEPLPSSRQVKAQILASGYTPAKRNQEIACLAVCLVLMAVVAVQLIRYFDAKEWPWVLFCVAAGITSADFISGVVHWAADTWGTVELPLVGSTIIRSFREHHVHPTAILHHDFVQTNADSFAACIPVLGVMVNTLLTGDDSVIEAKHGWYTFLFFLTVFASLSNQFHKLSHCYFGLPWYITVLQDLHIILPRKHHRIHHVSPHETYYCITTGWLNFPLEKIDFWRKVENVIQFVTGAVPRSDDMKWVAAGGDKKE
eukprot:Nk52_evm24s2340 gene=Nk52_evmTU24s2340